MKKTNDLIRNMALNAMIASIYALFTMLIQPLAYRELQFRLSEILVLLAFYNRNYTLGLTLGCFIANIPSPLGLIDWVVGTLSTLLVCLAMNRMSNIYLASLAGSLITGLIVGGELAMVYHLPYIINVLYVFVGEFVVLMIGTFIFKRLEKNPKIKEYLDMK